jgi:hypothetical protein
MLVFFLYKTIIAAKIGVKNRLIRKSVRVPIDDLYPGRSSSHRVPDKKQSVRIQQYPST